ncbi:MAG: UDP-N-acetylmuramoyl-L-alanine--D-glutamate ligase [Candidatus Falkowbacteria bacterium]
MKIEIKKPNIFTFESYFINEKLNTISFNYSFNNGLKFTESISLGGGQINWKGLNHELINRIVFNLQLALGIGYYKTYCPKKIVIKNGVLSKAEAVFWNKLYTKGLGEFFYRNKIDYRGLINFPYQKNQKTQAINIKLSNNVLLPWGGGKDSCVSAELLKELGHDFTLITLRDSDIQRATAKISGKRRIINERTIDPALIELNKTGVYNGHIPISAIYSWTTVLTAALYNYRHIIYSNEASANFGNVKYLGSEINHQYSKSLEFENDFREYLKNFVSPDINHFSSLRQFSDLKISRLFSKYPQYFPVFSSCNRNFSITKHSSSRWCGKCPKCLFTFSQLAAYIERPKLINIFGQNLFAKKELLPLFQELWGEKRFKPFDCVGTPNEVRAALLLVSAKAAWREDYIVKYFQKNIASKINKPENIISAALKNKSEHNIPADFRSTLILGYGLEGKFAYSYLRHKYPDFKFALADKKPITISDKKVKVISGQNYLDAINDYEVIIKSPGISNFEPRLIKAKSAGREISSITNIFLSVYGAQTIGVTGTKGKSTTASLIYEILKASGKKVYLIGNIGFDPLEHLTAKFDENKIFVYELSSYQLSIADQSPHIAVFINIFPDHLPYHQGFNNYFRAKTNITNFQKNNDFLVYNSEYEAIKKLAANTKAKAVSYLKECSIQNDSIYYHKEKIIALNKIKLLGTHNLKNIMAAICVAKQYKAADTAIYKALVKFVNLEHRLQFVGQFKGISFYDDAISTTPESTLVALEVFKEKIGTIILGGEDRGYKFSTLAKRLAELKIENFVFFPDSGEKIAKEIKLAYQKKKLTLPKILFTKNMDAAVKFSYQNTKPEQVCLLSTASPSYSLFKDFKEKGNLFQSAIKKIQ